MNRKKATKERMDGEFLENVNRYQEFLKYCREKRWGGFDRFVGLEMIRYLNVAINS